MVSFCVSKGSVDTRQPPVHITNHIHLAIEGRKQEPSYCFKTQEPLFLKTMRVACGETLGMVPPPLHKHPFSELAQLEKMDEKEKVTNDSHMDIRVYAYMESLPVIAQRACLRGRRVREISANIGKIIKITTFFWEWRD